MGIRLQVGECYGILLTKEEKKISYKKIEDLILPYLRTVYTTHKDIGKWVRTDTQSLFFQLWAFGYVDVHLNNYDESEVPENFFCQQILTPQQEFGSLSFFGLIGSQHENDSIDYAFISLIRYLASIFPSRRSINDGYQFEFAIPPSNIIRDASKDTVFPKFEMELNTLNEFSVCKKKMDKKLNQYVYVPSERMLFGDQYFTKAIIERGKNKKSYFFDTKEECEAFIDTYYKTNDYTGTFFQPAWQLIKLVYPDVPLERVKRYIVGWWE